MKQKWTVWLPYLAALGLDFYLLPFLARDTGAAMLLMLCVMPLAAFCTALIGGARHGFSLLLPLAALALFLPSVFLHYNATAWVYGPVYAAVVLAGNALGRLFYGRR